MEQATIIHPDATVDGENPIWCEQCGEWHARYSFTEVGLCFGCAFDDPETRAGIPEPERSLIFEAVMLCRDDPPEEYVRGIAELLTALMGMSLAEHSDSVRGWLVEPHQAKSCGE